MRSVLGFIKGVWKMQAVEEVAVEVRHGRRDLGPDGPGNNRARDSSMLLRRAKILEFLTLRSGHATRK